MPLLFSFLSSELLFRNFSFFPNLATHSVAKSVQSARLRSKTISVSAVSKTAFESSDCAQLLRLSLLCFQLTSTSFDLVLPRVEPVESKSNSFLHLQSFLSSNDFHTYSDRVYLSLGRT